ncbi:MAG: shikimate dehydrogenase [Pseudomonadota bacterium]
MTKLLGVAGDPISHSMSPLIHNGWLRDMGYDASYEAFHIKEGEFPEALETLKSRDILGLNVTLPHKHVALESAALASDAALRIGAANTLTLQPDRSWAAENTDAPGFMKALGPVDPHRDHILILGAGGSARAVVYALAGAGVKLTVLNRTVQRADDLVKALGDQNSAYGMIDQYKDYIDSATTVINTTSMGYGGEVLKLAAGRDRLFFDLSYGKISAAQIAEAADQGWRTMDGLTMLVAQAAYSFEIWFGEMPDLDAALRRCQMAMKAIS